MSAGHLVIESLTVKFPVQGKGTLTAVDDVSLALAPGEILGLVGESGCGKSTLARAVVGLERPAQGRILLDGDDLTQLKGSRRRQLRRRVQLVFQDPESSLSPRLTIGQTLQEPLQIMGMSDRVARAARAAELLEMVGLPSHFASRSPGALSGGQRQRVGIARALASEPDVLVCDEPVSALDVSVRAQIMNVLLDLRADLGVGCLFIAHDLGLVHQACDRIAVMYLGSIVEIGPSDALYRAPEHPYSTALLSAVPVADPDLERSRSRVILTGEVASPIDLPSGCRFRTRCPIGQQRCADDAPSLRPAGAGSAACHFPGQMRAELAQQTATG